MGSRLLVLFLTRFFDRTPDQPPLDNVDWSTDPAKLPLADVVIVHLPNCSPHWRMRRYPGQTWVAWSMESAVNYPRMSNAAFMRQFDLRMTYERDADVWMPYLPSVAGWETIREAAPARQEEEAPVAAFISGRGDRAGRAPLLQELFRYVGVHSYGRLLNNRPFADDAGDRTSKRRIAARYPFCLAFENSISADYVTEKIFDALRAGSIPVYLGAPNVAQYVPPGSYIDAAAYPGARELGTHLRYLAAHPGEAAKYHAWRAQPLPEALTERATALETPVLERLLEICRQRHEGRRTRRQLSRIRRLADGLYVRLRRRQPAQPS